MGKNCGRTAQGKREAAGQQFPVQHKLFRQTIEDQVQVDFTDNAYVQGRPWFSSAGLGLLSSSRNALLGSIAFTFTLVSVKLHSAKGLTHFPSLVSLTFELEPSRPSLALLLIVLLLSTGQMKENDIKRNSSTVSWLFGVGSGQLSI